MKLHILHLTVFLTLLIPGNELFAQKGFEINKRSDSTGVDILYNNNLLTSYRTIDSIKKPILFPINTLNGITITRGYPLAPREGDQTDHPHHTGFWMNYESVNGLDFWNNSTAIPSERKDRYGHIVHEAYRQLRSKENQAILGVTATWFTPKNVALLHETTRYQFEVKNNGFIITRTTTLQALDSAVVFKDVKDGFFAIRVTRELEQPHKEAKEFVDVHGNVTTTQPSIGTTGLYSSSNGKTGDAVWGTRGQWVNLSGKKQGTDISIAILDHPGNPGYPAYWHARGYGLFAVNPLGQKIFSNGKEELNLMLKPGEATTFKYRVIVSAGKKLDRRKMETLFKEFSLVK